ncbi:hypothetical protein C0Z18_01715 [Trinickia dabaoshanensis]|uniref:histidine kinase n=1 Tax=Trinickia dabaoshanensis TaxID=564714 RepID=A0A2N7W3B1_9BURK|nr:sensor histidine kinase [Trinickia dabaoshanensis]PMS23899.1 hypothetical protein C0Z18_01715 [Trinickia dabaoshanensis]
MYSLLPAFVSALFLGFGVYVLATEGSTRVSAPFVAICATTFAWQGTWALLFQTSRADVGGVLVKIGYLFILFLPTTFYHFVTEVVSARSERTMLWSSYCVCAVLAIALMTGDGVISGMRAHSFGYYPQAGRLHPIHVVQTAFLAGRSAWLLLEAKRSRYARGLPNLFNPCLASLCMYCVAASDYAVNYGYDFYPVGVIFIAIGPGILAVAIVRYGLIRPRLTLATVAHEVASPLATIGLHADELRRVVPELMRGYRLAVEHGLCTDKSFLLEEPERIAALAPAIRQQVDGTSTVIEMSLASLTLDRLDRRQFASHSIDACVQSALDRFPFKAGERDQVQATGIDPAIRFFGSDSLLVCALFNLLKNGMDAIRSRGEGGLDIRAERRDGFCLLRVTDGGPGIAPEVLPRIFEPFYSTKAHGRGAGVGLTFCRSVCEAFGGAISCESEVGVRTTFTLCLPERESLADDGRDAFPPSAESFRV